MNCDVFCNRADSQAAHASPNTKLGLNVKWPYDIMKKRVSRICGMIPSSPLSVQTTTDARQDHQQSEATTQDNVFAGLSKARSRLRRRSCAIRGWCGRSDDDGCSSSQHDPRATAVIISSAHLEVSWLVVATLGMEVSPRGLLWLRLLVPRFSHTQLEQGIPKNNSEFTRSI